MTKFTDDVVADAGWLKANWHWLRWVLLTGLGFVAGAVWHWSL